MTNETDILLNIFKELHRNIEHIKSSKNKVKQIQNSINSLNNNFFEVKCNNNLLTEYLHMFEDTDAFNTTIINLETLITQVEHHITNTCEHEWIIDSIDIDPGTSQNICYCVKCEITKKSSK